MALPILAHWAGRSIFDIEPAALARRDRRGAARITGSALRSTARLSLPSGVGPVVLGSPTFRLLFPKLNVAVAGPLLSTLGIATPFVCMVLVCNSVLQAHGFINLPVILMVLGGIVDEPTNPLDVDAKEEVQIGRAPCRERV